MRTVWFMTGNVGKVREAKHALEPLGFEVKQLVVGGVEISEPQCDDLEIVARSKLEQAQAHLPHPHAALLVEDAGLFVDALAGFPGVYSAYVLKTLGCNGLLKLMEGKNNRNAEFQAVAALLLDGDVFISRGVCEGVLAANASGKDGFGFDPIFVPNDIEREGIIHTTEGLTFADVNLSVKEKFSHRRKALDGLLELLSTPEAASSS
ncbi:MAG: Non-canonical purine NTP pyrophosphatase [Candidatus Poseidoniaceae archaeon]|nr:MAG: Non-canonical purine NTP pyrophosphatase [Candidatus Poseidoniaceae archaeon]